MKKHNSIDTNEQYESMHTPRWKLTMEWLRGSVRTIPANSRILEVSNQSPLALMMETYFGCPVDNTEFDVRDAMRWNEMFSDYSLVVCTEVIEHLPDCNDEYGEFHMRGVMACLAGCLKVLVPGGWLMLTTPNASSFVALEQWLRGLDPMNWIFHPREFGYKTVLGAVKDAGFNIVRSATENPYDHAKTKEFLERRAWLNEKMGTMGASGEFRGETTFILARKGNSNG